MHIQKTTFTTKKPLIVVLIAALLLGAGFAYVYYATDIFSDNATTETAIDPNINLDPPTEQEVKDSQNAKERILEGDESSSDSTDQPDTGKNNPDQSNKKKATVGISYADINNGKLEVRAFTPSVIEGTGTCTATISKAESPSITKSVSAFVDVSSTICQPIYIPKSELSAGTWNLEVIFSSPTHQGSSGITKVEVS